MRETSGRNREALDVEMSLLQSSEYEDLGQFQDLQGPRIRDEPRSSVIDQLRHRAKEVLSVSWMRKDLRLVGSAVRGVGALRAACGRPCQRRRAAHVPAVPAHVRRARHVRVLCLRRVASAAPAPAAVCGPGRVRRRQHVGFDTGADVCGARQHGRARVARTGVCHDSVAVPGRRARDRAHARRGRPARVQHA